MKIVQKKCQVVLLPSNEPAVLHRDKEQTLFAKDLGFERGLFNKQNNYIHNPHNLYILSDEEIKEYDWFFVSNSVLQRVNTPIESKYDDVYHFKEKDKHYYSCISKKICKKIIATTNPELGEILEFYGGGGTGEGFAPLPKPIDQFIQDWIAKGCSEMINVEYEKVPKTNEELEYDKPSHKEVLKISQDNTITCSFIEDEIYHLTKFQLEKLAVNAVSKSYDDGVLNIDKWLKENYNPPTRKES